MLWQFFSVLLSNRLRLQANILPKESRGSMSCPKTSKLLCEIMGQSQQEPTERLTSLATLLMPGRILCWLIVAPVPRKMCETIQRSRLSHSHCWLR